MQTTRPRPLTDKARWYLDQLKYGSVQCVHVTPKNEKALAQLVRTGFCVERSHGRTRYVLTAERAAELS